MCADYALVDMYYSVEMRAYEDDFSNVQTKVQARDWNGAADELRNTTWCSEAGGTRCDNDAAQFQYCNNMTADLLETAVN